MIRYALRCSEAHEFEAWFASSGAFDAQVRRSQVVCPHCGSKKVTKGVMAPNIAPASGSGSERRASRDDGAAPDEAVAILRKLREHVEKNAENVGDRFAVEARKIHHEETEPRGIYGSATVDEARELREEGIAFHPLPELPEDHN
jgi:hypothetical protein